MKSIVIGILAIALIFSLESAFAQYMHEHKHDEMHHQMKESLGDVGICPVSGEKASGDYSYIYKGKTYYFCCPNCIEEFKKDPEKYISRMKEIKLEAYQYGFSPDPIVVKKGDIVKLDITSRDVTHGVSIKEYGINVPIDKGGHKKVEFFADKEGQFNIICSVYCGSGHSRMRGKLIVEK